MKKCLMAYADSEGPDQTGLMAYADSEGPDQTGMAYADSEGPDQTAHAQSDQNIRCPLTEYNDVYSEDHGQIV